MGIRVVPQETVPKEVDRHLQPDERQSITVRKHPAQPALRVLPLVLVLTDYVLHATGAVHGSARAKFILVVLMVPACILAVHSITSWLLSYVVVTPKRILLLDWLRVPHPTEIPLSAAADLSFIRSVPGRLLGYGTFRVKRPRSRWRTLKIRFLPYSEQLYIEVCGLIFRDPGADPSDD